MSKENKSQLIHNYLVNKIKNKELKPFDAIESENELAKKFDVSRMTVRKVLDILVDRGFLFREHGKGTFVAEYAESGRTFLSMTELAAARGQEITNKVITYYKGVPTAEVMSNLKVKRNQEILYIERLRLIEDEPYAYEMLSFISSVFGECNEEILKGSIYNHLERNRNLVIVLSKQEIESVSAHENLASWLNVAVGTPLLKIRTVSILKNGKAFEFTDTYYRSDRYKVEQISYR